MGNHPFFILNYYMNKRFSLILISFAVIFYSCSSTKEEIKEAKRTVDTSYVFDKIPPEDLYKFENPEKKSTTFYLIQIGAFSTLDTAGKFAKSSRAKLNKDIKVEYDESKKLYLVRINQPFTNKNEALLFREKINTYPDYKDAWVVEVIENSDKK